STRTRTATTSRPMERVANTMPSRGHFPGVSVERSAWWSIARSARPRRNFIDWSPSIRKTCNPKLAHDREAVPAQVSGARAFQLLDGDQAFLAANAPRELLGQRRARRRQTRYNDL